MAIRSSQRVKPAWLRPTAFLVVALLHVGVVIGAPWPGAPELAVAAPLTIQVVPEGRTTTAIEAPQQVQVAEVNAVQIQPSDSQPSQAKAVESPPPENPAIKRPVEEARAVSAQQVALAIEPTEQTLTAVETHEPARQEDQPERKKTEAKEKSKQQDKEHARESAAARARSRASAVSRQSLASAVTGAAASATYRSLVAAELNRRKFYPPGARASGAEGVVMVSFTIGGSGRVTAHSITRSSGKAALDQAVHQMMASVSLPPPPGGVFRATVPIRFDIAH